MSVLLVAGRLVDHGRNMVGDGVRVQRSYDGFTHGPRVSSRLTGQSPLDMIMNKVFGVPTLVVVEVVS